MAVKLRGVVRRDLLVKQLSSEVESSVGSPRRASFNRALKSVSPAASS